MQWGEDLQSEHEQFLVDSCGRLPIFITDYPASTKAFYARANEHDGGKTVSYSNWGDQGGEPSLTDTVLPWSCTCR